MKTSLKLLSIIVLATIIFFSCEKEEFTTAKSATLEFSDDTVHFDTVFTTIGSATKNFRVYNNNSKSLRITSIRLGKGKNSPFKINIDGLPADSATDVEVYTKDSIFIFVQVIIDPTNKNNPLLVSDSIIFEYNGNIQTVKLEAWGQDVHLLKNETHLKTQTWTNDKPYLIYDTLGVDSGQILTVEKGTTLYFHKKGIVMVKGTLVVNGTKNEPVTFRGDRFDNLYSGQPYDKTPAQWSGIWLRKTSNNNVFNYAEIRNAITALYIGEVNNTQTADAKLLNCKINNCSSAGLFSTHANILAANCVISNCGQFCVSTLGGSVDFYQCTFANYYSIGNHSITAFVTNRIIYEGSDYVKDTIYDDLNHAYFGNCIIYGSNTNELFIDGTQDRPLNYKFENCLVKYDLQTNENPFIDVADQTKFKKNYFSTEDANIFKSVEANKCNFELDKKSLAKNRGNIDVAKKYPLDINQYNRLTDNNPDIGAYESTE